MSGPRLSVVVPAHRAETVLPQCAEALLASDLPREAWELIVVDDASPDGTAELAGRWADDVIRLGPRPGGPGLARNRGVERARAPVVLFVDSDVCVSPHTLARVVEDFERDPALVALFGSYDEEPAAQGFLSEYRNLLHRYHHVRTAGEAETFWAGCGAVRTEAFRAVGGFDARRFPRPQIEDIELGYRLRDAGGKIRLDPAVECKHLKHWTWSGMLRTDLRDRGIPWMRLLLERGNSSRATLNVDATEKTRTALAAGSLLALVLGTILRLWPLAATGLAGLAALTLWNHALLRWFAGVRGWGFAMRVIPMQILYYLLNAVAAALGILGHLRHRSAAQREADRPTPA
ncbi:MAG: glycosyltransferase [Gemmatimonadota bacterium]